MSVENLVSSGPLILAIPVAAAAGALTFLSPCCLPLVPGYLSYITGMSGAGASGREADGATESAAVKGGGAAAVAVAESGSGGVTTATVTAADAPGSAAASRGTGGLSSPRIPLEAGPSRGPRCSSSGSPPSSRSTGSRSAGSATCSAPITPGSLRSSG